jgi:hypothetical protein
LILSFQVPDLSLLQQNAKPVSEERANNCDVGSDGQKSFYFSFSNAAATDDKTPPLLHFEKDRIVPHRNLPLLRQKLRSARVYYTRLFPQPPRQIAFCRLEWIVGPQNAHATPQSLRDFRFKQLRAKQTDIQ